MLKYFLCVTLSALNLLVSGFPSRAAGVEADSVLCKQRNLYTVVALSTNDYNVGIYYNNQNERGYYIGQSKRDNSSIVLPLILQYDSELEEMLPFKREYRGLTYKAINKQYTYQVSLKEIYDLWYW
ncbi:hypothetical protein [Chroococcidiopsis sp. TS-821]|nr:hypothetical protein [Chroococcidiopsis sp. TS-821]